MKFRELKLYSVLNNRCPRCRRGKYFVTDHPYHLGKFATMERSCAVCGLDYRQEPGFYFGATYVSYGIQVAIVLLSYLIFCVVLDLEIWVFAAITMGILLLLLPLTFRLSRLTWLTLFGDYKETGLKKKECP